MKSLDVSRVTKCMKILEASVLIVILAFGYSSAQAVTLPFEDDFENIAVGDYPDQNGWRILFSGKSAYVSDAVAYTGTRSFRLDSWPNWAHMDYVYLDQVPDQLTYEASVYVDPSEGKGAYVGFMKGVVNMGPTWNIFSIGGQTGVRFSGAPGASVYCGPYTPGTWCTVRADLDFLNLTARVWRDGQLVDNGVAIWPKQFDDPPWGHVILDKWGLVSTNYPSGSTNVVYFDDVSIVAGPPKIVAAIDIDPDTLNLKSKGNWITCYIELPEGYDVDDIDVSTITLNGQVPAELRPSEVGDYDDDGIADLMVKFDRSAVQEILQTGDEVEITVTGELTDGTPFEGSDTIRVIDKGGKKD